MKWIASVSALGLLTLFVFASFGRARASAPSEADLWETPPSRAGLPPDQVDAHSWGNPHQVRVRHVAIDLNVDFDARRLEGAAVLALERAPDAEDATVLWLDTRDLEIEAAEVPDKAGGWTEVAFQLGNPTVSEDEKRRFPAGTRSDGAPIHGTALAIAVGSADRVRIRYRTSPDASALQWLEPSQTAGGADPFLFTQSQAIHARSWIPLQDSPGGRVTYEATIAVPDGLKAVMSASGNFGETDAERPFRFALDRPIPTYLIALAVGDLAFRPLGPRTGVYAEPSVIEAAAFEFADTEAMMETTEARFGPYRWERYDLLVLPPSFPFGGMENPMLTFATPTILAGDRSLTSLVAHELAHSWSGNLVTNATWRDFWLNEGFTTYIENRIIEDVYGPERAVMENVLGLAGLRAELERLEPRDEILHIDLWGRDPDDNVTAVPYEKGKFFLRELEIAFGRDRFDPFLRAYFDTFAFQSMTTPRFEAYLRQNLLAKDPEAAESIDIQRWLYEPGLPPIHEPTSERLDAVERRANTWIAQDIAAEQLDAGDWTTQEWLYFLDRLPRDLDTDRLAALDRAWTLTESGNAEIAARWLELAIHAGYEPADARLERFLTSIGRRKFLMPLYEALVKADRLDRARAIYAKARPKYHPIAIESLERLLGAE